MMDIEKQPTPEKMEGGGNEAAFAPPPYPTDPTSMQQPAPYTAPPYPYGPTVYPAYPPVPPGGDFLPPAQDINIQDSPVGGAGTN